MVANLRPGCSVCSIALYAAVILIFQIRPILCDAQVVFGPDDPNNNEVFYTGETVTLRCEVLGVSSADVIQFSISQGGNALITNNTNLSHDTITNTRIFGSYVTFVLKSFANETEYDCTAVSRRTHYGRRVYKLGLQQPYTVHCRRNITDMYISMQVVRLSCYFTPSENKIVKWFKNNSNSAVELSSKKVAVNNFKHKLVSVIHPADELSLSYYFCEESQVGSTTVPTQPARKCDAGSFLVYNNAFTFISPNLSSIPKGSSRNLTYKSVTLPQQSVEIWLPLPQDTVPVGVNVTIHDSFLVEIQVSADADVGAVINLTCKTFIGGVILNSDFSIVIEADDDNSTSKNYVTIIIVIVSLVVIVIITSFILVLYLCFCRKKDDPEKVIIEQPAVVDESTSNTTYGVVDNDKKDKSGDEKEFDGTLKEDGIGEENYSLAQLRANRNKGGTNTSSDHADQSNNVGADCTGVTVNSPDDDLSPSEVYTPVVRNSNNDEKY